MTDIPITQSQLDALERVADKVFGKLGIDIDFTRHFLDRVNDERNKKQITIRELGQLFAKEYYRWGRDISRMTVDSQAVMKDLSSAINIPFVLNKDGKGKSLVAKTVMRKSNFKTPDHEYPVESVEADKPDPVEVRRDNIKKKNISNADLDKIAATSKLMKQQPNFKTPTPTAIANKHDVDLSMIRQQLKMGVKVEMEHTPDKHTAMEIALDHLAEMPNYYSKLSDMGNDISEMLSKGAWEVAQLHEHIMDPREQILRKALQCLDHMIKEKGDTQSIGGYAFDITRSFNLKDIATAKELTDLYRDWKSDATIESNT
tara:strand:+ start:164 stop:1111 length:948 start_codon:yes stop_codon:yes gene_type:complete